MARVADQLIESAAGLIAAHGAAGLTVRGVAEAAGTSTMSVYTHFGGIDGLRHAVRREGFARLGTRVNQAGRTDDPVADLSLMGLVYFRHAIEEPDLYRVMFLERVADAVDAEIGWDVFDALVQGVQRCIEANRFGPGDASRRATEMWALAHGTATLHLAGLLDEDAALAALGAGAHHLLVGFGDTPGAASGSLSACLARDFGQSLPP